MSKLNDGHATAKRALNQPRSGVLGGRSLSFSRTAGCISGRCAVPGIIPCRNPGSKQYSQEFCPKMWNAAGQQEALVALARARGPLLQTPVLAHSRRLNVSKLNDGHPAAKRTLISQPCSAVPGRRSISFFMTFGCINGRPTHSREQFSGETRVPNDTCSQKPPPKRGRALVAPGRRCSFVPARRVSTGTMQVVRLRISQTARFAVLIPLVPVTIVKLLRLRARQPQRFTRVRS